MENFKGNILPLVGEKDRMWDSTGAASTIAAHASRRPDGSSTVEAFTYSGAEHTSAFITYAASKRWLRSARFTRS